MTAIGVPIKILHEAEGHIVTLETTIGRFALCTRLLICLLCAALRSSELLLLPLE